MAEDRSSRSPESVERIIPRRSGWPFLAVSLAMVLSGLCFSAVTLVAADATREDAWALLLFLTIPVALIGFVMLFGLFTLQPNEARLLILFGEYKGTVRESGFCWTNPFNTKLKMSLRARNFDGDQLKVNDQRGNPIEISAVVVWRVADTAKAVFDVDRYEEYVRIQSDSALRHLAGDYAYDSGDEEGINLRSGAEEVSAVLKAHLQERLSTAGVEVIEARLNHLAYAPEIAGAMLRRQQAEAVIAARQKIVQGAVSMVEMALNDLARKGVVQFDDDRRANMVSNLLVVLCGESAAQPVVNASAF